MDDGEIIALFWKRDEAAIRETGTAYGSRLYALAEQILRCREDAHRTREKLRQFLQREGIEV